MKPTFKKLLSGKDSSPCWFCQNPTQHAAYKSDGSEIWCCIDCLWEKKKIKNFNPKTERYSDFQRKCKECLNLCVRKNKTTHGAEDEDED